MKNWPIRSFFSRHMATLAVGTLLALCVSAQDGRAFEPASTGSFRVLELAAYSPKSGQGDTLDRQNSWSIFHKDEKSTVSIYYPQMDNALIDGQLAHWADVRLRTFVTGVAALGEGKSRYSMQIDYTLSQTSPRFVSVLFRISTETGGTRPDLGLTAFSYDLQTGQTLSYGDIFVEPESFMVFAANYAQEDLLRRLGRSERTLILRGTAPSEGNFAYFTLRPDGLEIFFPPYQVASSSLGEQSVVIPLTKLAPYGPDPKIWGAKK